MLSSVIRTALPDSQAMGWCPGGGQLEERVWPLTWPSPGGVAEAMQGSGLESDDILP